MQNRTINVSANELAVLIYDHGVSSQRADNIATALLERFDITTKQSASGAGDIEPPASAADTSDETGTPDPPPHLDGEIEPPAR